MALVKSVVLCGINSEVHTSEDTTKESTYFLFPELTVSKKKRGQQQPEVSQLQIGKRSFNTVLDIFALVSDAGAKSQISDGKLKELSPVLYKAIKESGNDPMEFYLQVGSVISDLEAEEESASASNPSTIMCNFAASNFGLESKIPETTEEYREMLAGFLANMTDAQIEDSRKMLQKKETELGRYDSGQIRTRKQKQAKVAA